MAFKSLLRGFNSLGNNRGGFSNTVMDGSMQSTITATILGLAAQIEREFISTRTKEALSQCKAKGIKLGRQGVQQPLYGSIT